jgi:Flp pilus assembly protein TadG
MVLTQRYARRRRGASIVEFALVCGLCLMLLLGVIDFGRILFVNHLLTNAAREGARYAVVHTHDLTTTDIQDYVRGRLVNQDLQLNATISVYRVNPSTGTNLGEWTDAGFGEAIAVKIEGTLHPIVPRLLLLRPAITMERTSIMYSESN